MCGTPYGLDSNNEHTPAVTHKSRGPDETWTKPNLGSFSDNIVPAIVGKRTLNLSERKDIKDIMMLIDEVDETSVSNQLTASKGGDTFDEKRKKLLPILKYVASFKSSSKTPENVVHNQLRPHSLLDTSDFIAQRGNSILDIIASNGARVLNESSSLSSNRKNK